MTLQFSPPVPQTVKRKHVSYFTLNKMLYVCGLGDDGLTLCQLKQLAAMM